jgi:hypothetical protein
VLPLSRTNKFLEACARLYPLRAGSHGWRRKKNAAVMPARYSLTFRIVTRYTSTFIELLVTDEKLNESGGVPC